MEFAKIGEFICYFILRRSFIAVSSKFGLFKFTFVEVGEEGEVCALEEVFRFVISR